MGMRILLLVLITLHGLLHLLGFVKAFKLASIPQLQHPINKKNGILWLMAGLMIITSGVLFYTFTDGWWMLGIASVVISEYLIIKDWEDAGLGTPLNILLLLISIIGFILS
jgi:hypothetical protein